jgi:hypothetical protein
MPPPAASNVLNESSNLEQTPPSQTTEPRNNPTASIESMPPRMSEDVVEYMSNETLSLEQSPCWAETYQPGSLAMLGLTPGQYDPNITTPQRKKSGPTGTHLGTTRTPSIP